MHFELTHLVLVLLIALFLLLICCNFEPTQHIHESCPDIESLCVLIDQPFNVAGFNLTITSGEK